MAPGLRAVESVTVMVEGVAAAGVLEQYLPERTHLEVSMAERTRDVTDF